MRLIFLTNYYPPHSSGGQEMTCLQVVEGLKLRNHLTRVLTSMHGVGNNPVVVEGIHRTLYLEMENVPWMQNLTLFKRRKARDQHNRDYLKDQIAEFRPDIIFIWGMWNLTYSLAALAESECPGKVVYRFGDYWPTLPSQWVTYWEVVGRKWYARLPKKLLSKVALALLARDDHLPPLKFEHAICISKASQRELVDQGIPLADVRIIYGGINVPRFLNFDTINKENEDKRYLDLVYIGRLSPEKGIETAILALDKLVNVQGRQDIQLTIVGSGPEDYVKDLKKLVEERKLSNHVSFNGRVSSEDVPKLLQRFDVMVVPSLWIEPFGRVVLEGMVSQLAVIASDIGGPGEIIVNGKNGLLFSPGDRDDLAQKIERLYLDPDLLAELAGAGRETVLSQFTHTFMIDKIESYLLEVSQG